MIVFPLHIKIKMDEIFFSLKKEKKNMRLPCAKSDNKIKQLTLKWITHKTRLHCLHHRGARYRHFTYT